MTTAAPEGTRSFLHHLGIMGIVRKSGLFKLKSTPPYQLELLSNHCVKGVGRRRQHLSLAPGLLWYACNPRGMLACNAWEDTLKDADAKGANLCHDMATLWKHQNQRYREVSSDLVVALRT